MPRSSAVFSLAVSLAVATSGPPRWVAAQASADTATLEGEVPCYSDHPRVVYVEADGAAKVEPPVQPALMNQKGLRFIPHVLPVVVGRRVGFLNSDPVQHNVFSASPPRPFNLGSYPSGTTRYVTFDRPGVVEVLCNVHPEMGAYIVVLETPHFALTQEDGRYRIEGLSPGLHTVGVWCEIHGKRNQQVRLGPGTTRLSFKRVAR